MKKRFLATFLALCLALGLLPGTVWAAENAEGEPETAFENANGGTEDSIAFEESYTEEENQEISPLSISLQTEIGGNSKVRYSVLILDLSGAYILWPNGYGPGKPSIKVGAAIDKVKQAARKFVNQIATAPGENYIALVTYGPQSSVISGFTKDYTALNSSIAELTQIAGRSNTNSALIQADTLINSITDKDVTKNVLLFSGRLPDEGEYVLSGHYSQNSYSWTRLDNKRYIYGYCNPAYDTAQHLMNKCNLYTLGCFTNLNQQKTTYDFTLRFMKEIQNSGFFDATTPDDLEFVFGEVADEITGQWKFDPDTGKLTIGIQGYDMPDYSATNHAPWYRYAEQITEVEIADGLTKVGAYAFDGCKNLEFIKFPYGVNKIGAYALKECSNIFMACLPSTLIAIGEGVFSDCESLEKILYAGSQSQWEEISIESNNFSWDSAAADVPVWYGSYGESRPLTFCHQASKITTTLDYTWDLSELNIASTTSPNLNFAALGTILSYDIEQGQDIIESRLKSLGCKDVRTYNIRTEFSILDFVAGTPGMTFGHLLMSDSKGNDQHVIIGVIRGTTTAGDILTDVGSLLGGLSFGICAENAAWNLGEFMKECGLSNADIGKLLVCGHSLAGATVDCWTPKLNGYFGPDNVFAYTIAPPLTTGRYGNLSIGKTTNVHNYINDADIVPNVGAGLGRNGIDYKFRATWPGYEQTATNYKKLTNENLDTNLSGIAGALKQPHWAETYMALLMCKAPVRPLPPVKFPTVVHIACPVDVEVIDSTGNVIGLVIDDKITSYIPGDTKILVDGDEKTVIFTDNGEYTINIVGTGEGTMNYSAYSYDLESKSIVAQKKFENVEIVNDKKFTTEIWADEQSSESKIAEIQLYVLDSFDTPIKEVLSDGVEVPITPPTPGHTHNWSATWSSNATHHWHDCTASGCDITSNHDKNGYAEHVYDDDTDDTCNTCGYTRTVTPPVPEHTHNWSAAWSSDATHHWHDCTANGCDITSNSDKDGYGAHVYNHSSDATCNICGYIRDVAPSSDDTNYIAVLKTGNGEIICNTRYAAQGERVTLSAHPAAGYELESVTVTDVRGRTVTVREVSDNRYTFTMPATRVKVAATFIKTEADATPKDDELFTGLGTPGISGIVLNPAPLPFTDVQPQHWFYDNVDYVWKRYLMSGVSDTRFAPQLTTSRAMIWTILARMNNVRTDVNPGATWYERGMLWAMEQGVTDGTNPMGDITREQLAAMLWRNAGRPAPGDAADLTQFRDSNAVSGYAQTAVRWAVSVGILNGSNGEIDPQGTATRAQVVAMAARYGDRFA